jgi:hypothetical protein
MLSPSVASLSSRRRTVAPIALACLVCAATACGGPEAFRGLASISGAAGNPSGATGSGGGNDAAAIDDAAGGGGGTGGTPTALGGADGGAGLGGAAGGVGAAGIGAAGVAGQGAAGTAAAGMGAAGVGVAGAGGTGVAGVSGQAGAGGQAGSGGKAGAAGAAGSPDAGVDAPASCNCMVKVQYECKQDGPSVGMAEYAIKVVNTGTTPVALNEVTVRYWYTIDGTGGQTGLCAGVTQPCTIAFQSASPAKSTADEYAVISFGSGTLAPGADTGELDVTMLGTGNYTQTNDYSFASTGAVFMDAPHITAYGSGKLIWGTAP